VNENEISVVGLGYVGLPLALLAAKKEFTVNGIDTHAKKVDLINQRKSPFVDDEIQEQLEKYDIQAKTTFDAIPNSRIVIVCVPTPVDEKHHPDLTILKSACRQIGENLIKGQLVIIESTINPGVCENIAIPTLEATSKLKNGEDFFVAHCPERVNPGDEKWNVENIPRVVGSTHQKGLEIAESFYKRLLSAPVMPMATIQEAEAVKIVENSFRDINIAFVNELALSFSKLNINVTNVIRGASTKPFGFMAHYPGCGVGGHCIPVDPYYLIEHAMKRGFHHDLLASARRINNSMPIFTAELALETLSELGIPRSKAKFAILGLSYKPNIGDDRESPSYRIIETIRGKNIKHTIYDPYVPEQSTATNLDEALSGVDVVILATPHDEFKNIEPSRLKQKGVKAIIDGRNCLSPEVYRSAGILYRGIGV
jgi:nucleotide sugar dehydrogenase